jgi:hypothetical protein
MSQRNKTPKIGKTKEKNQIKKTLKKEKKKKNQKD